VRSAPERGVQASSVSQRTEGRNVFMGVAGLRRNWLDIWRARAT
jgi:hypothetical protein